MKKTHPKAGQPKQRHARAVPRGEDRLISLLGHAILLAAVCALFIPLVVNGSFFYSFVLLKSILFRAAVEVMLLLYILLATFAPSYRPRLHLMTYALLAWFGAMLISSLPGISVDAWSSWWGDFRRMGGMVAQLHLLGYFFVLAHTLKREREWLILFAASLFFGVWMGFSGMVQYLGLNYLYRFPQQGRIEGAAGNANLFAASMLLNFFVALWLLGRKDKSATYAVMANVWLVLILLLDLLVVVWDFFTGAGISSGLEFPAVGIFAALFHAVCLLWFATRRNARVGAIVIGSAGAWCIFWMYLTQTRGAVIGLVGSLLLVASLYLWHGASKNIKLLFACMILLFILTPAVILLNRQASWVQSHPTLLRYVLLSPTDAASANRLYNWSASARAIGDRPFFGWGLENYRIGFDLYFPVEVYRSLTGEFWFDRAHNLIIDIGMTTGLVGLAAYLAFFSLVIGFLVRQWVRAKDRIDILLILGLLLAYLLQGLFTFDTINTDPILYLVLAYVSYLFAANKNRPEANSGEPLLRRRQPMRAWIPLALACMVLPLAVSYAVIRPFQSNQLLQQARAATKVLNPMTHEVRLRFSENTLDLFRRADEYQTTGRSEVREEAANYAFELARAPYIPADQKLRAIKEGIRFLRESIEQAPANARSYQYLGSLVNGTFETIRQAEPQFAQSLAETTLPVLQKGETLSPNRPQMYFEKSQLLFFLGRKEERLAAFEKGASLSRAVKDPHIDLVNLYVEGGRYEDAAREWQNIKNLGFQLTRSDYDRLIQTYEAKKQFVPIVGLCQEQLAAAPGDVELLTKLAFSYRELGEMELARQTAIKAVSLSPAAASKLQSILKDPRK